MKPQQMNGNYSDGNILLHTRRKPFMDYRTEKKYVGHRDQLFQVTRMKLTDGKAEGSELLRIQNRSGMHFDVNISRGMDIPYLDFRGQNIGFLSPCGIVSPEYFDDQELGFLKSFTAGFMTTCGLKTIGSPSEFKGKKYGLHGNLSHTPADEVRYFIDETQDIPSVCIQGKLQDSIIFGERLSLSRSIRCSYQECKIELIDKVTNEGFKKARHMLLYHCNIGYPLLSPESELFIPSVEIKARNTYSLDGLSHWNTFQKPDPNYEEMCFYHKLQKDSKNHSAVAVYNPKLDMGLAIEFDANALDYFIQWKMMGAGDYVLGLEPANSTIDGIADAISNGSIKYLEAGESKKYYLLFQILKSKKEFELLKNHFQY